MSAARRTWSWGISVAAMAAMCWLSPARAGEGQEGKAQMEAPAGVVKATVEGTNTCVGCALKSKLGAGAQCSTLGHRHAFRVSRVVDADGKELTEMKGWVLHYLDTDKSEELLTKHHGEKLTITGAIYPQARVLEVGSFDKTAPKKG